MKRKYDIGHDVIITDDGFTISAEAKKGAACTTSIGIKRPPCGPVPDELDIQYSLDGRHFYLPKFADMQGFWLSVQTWKDRAEMQAQTGSGLFGKGCAVFSHPGSGEAYRREVLHFVSWNVKAEREQKKIAKLVELAQDYLALAQEEHREQERRFNEVIAHTGRTLKWIMDRIGPWQTVPPELPPIVLAD